MSNQSVTGIEIKVARIKAGLKQYELASRVGISAPRLSEIESGRRTADPALRTKILVGLSETPGKPQSHADHEECQGDDRRATPGAARP